MSFWDWKTGHRFQSMDTTAQPGSLDAESGIMSSTFDRSGLRLITGEADKTSMYSLISKHLFTSASYANSFKSKFGSKMKKRPRRRIRYNGRHHWHTGNFSQEFMGVHFMFVHRQKFFYISSGDGVRIEPAPHSGYHRRICVCLRMFFYAFPDYRREIAGHDGRSRLDFGSY